MLLSFPMVDGGFVGSRQEQRRHQRIRFGAPPSVVIGYNGQMGKGELENLSLGGLMVRTEIPLVVGAVFGCEFSIGGAPTVDVPAVVINRVGNLFGARFQSGPLSKIHIDQAVASAMNSGQASVLAVHEIAGRKVMRIQGGLNGSLHNDVMHSLSKVGIDGLDVSAVTAVDRAGMALCMVAVGHYGVRIEHQSDCFQAAWDESRHHPEWLDAELLAEISK